MIKIAVFVSGRGSNFGAILEEIAVGRISAEIKFLISDKIFCPAFEIADKYSIQKLSVANIEKPGFLTYEELVSELKAAEIDLIVLAGFLKKIPGIFITAFKDKIINIHPALLPSFGGAGMYGLNVHKAVFEKSCQVSGATVHFVDDIYDNGKIIAQACVDISNANSPEEIAEQVLKVEHKLLPQVVGNFALNRYYVENNRVRIKEITELN